METQVKTGREKFNETIKKMMRKDTDGDFRSYRRLDKELRTVI